MVEYTISRKLRLHQLEAKFVFIVPFWKKNAANKTKMLKI